MYSGLTVDAEEERKVQPAPADDPTLPTPSTPTTTTADPALHTHPLH